MQHQLLHLTHTRHPLMRNTDMHIRLTQLPGQGSATATGQRQNRHVAVMRCDHRLIVGSLTPIRRNQHQHIARLPQGMDLASQAVTGRRQRRPQGIG